MSTATETPAPVSTYQAGDVAPPALDPAPIDPDTILEGAPVARAKTVLRTDDERLSTTIWDCTAGRFTWFFGCDEIVHVIEGSVTVTDEQGRSRTLGVGDVALFQRDTTTTWDVPHYVRKVAVHRVVKDPFVVRVVRRLRKVLARRG